MLINMYYTVDIVKKSYIEQIKDWLPNLIVATLMGIIVYFSTMLFSSEFLQIIVGFVLGAFSYYVLSSIFKLEANEIVLNMMRRLLRKA